jgi:hypothetical protein
MDEDQLLCPLTFSVFVDPVKAEDGYTYSRGAIEEYLAKCCGASAITSPCIPGQPMGRDLKADEEMERLLATYREQQSAKIQAENRQLDRNRADAAAPQPRQEGQQPTRHIHDTKGDLTDLAHTFQQLDAVRDVLSDALAGWAPPRIVVVGMRSSGKSTLLERMTMMPIFPRGDGTCTRMPVHIELRNEVKPHLPKLAVRLEKTAKCEGEQTIAMEKGEASVRNAMDAALALEKVGHSHRAWPRACSAPWI